MNLEQQEASAGAAAADPTAAVSFQDLRYRYFDLKRGADLHSFETEGAYMLHPRLKLTNELRGVHTDRSGRWESDFQEVKLKAIFLTNGMPLGIKAKYAVGVEWLKDLGDFDEGTGTGADLIAPLLGIGWIPTQADLIVTLSQGFGLFLYSNGNEVLRRVGRISQWERVIQKLGPFGLLGLIDVENPQYINRAPIPKPES